MIEARGLMARWRAGRAAGDEEGSLILVLLLIMFMSIVILTVTTSAFGQLDLSNNDSALNGSLESALAGVQSAVGEIRSSSIDGDVNPSELPCQTISGSTGGVVDTTHTSYSASIQYYQETSAGTTSEVSCLQGSGPQITPGDYLEQAVITSCAPTNGCPASGGSGTSSSSWRRVVSTYTFDTTNVNIPGGLIYDYGKSDCLMAQQSGSSWQLYATTSCAPGNSNYDDELFQYTSTWNISIDLGDTEYCVVDPEVIALSVALSPCSGNTTNASYQWGINDSADLQGVVTGSSGDPNSLYLNDPIGGQAPSSGSSLSAAMTVIASASGFSDDYSWEFSPTVGSGGAVPSAGSSFGPTDQLVNYEEFGLCMDITNQNPTGGFNSGAGPGGYLIDYDCKQFPDTASYPAWNQRWCFDSITSITSGGYSVPEGLLFSPDNATNCTTTSGVTNYCAVSPEVAANGTNNDTNWVTVTPCTLNQSASSYSQGELWTNWGALGADASTDDAYAWTDQAGLCLETDTANQQTPGGGAYFSTIEVATCDGGYSEKWNAPSTLGDSQLSDTHEGTGDNWTSGTP